MRWWSVLLFALALAGCSKILGLSAPQLASDGGGGDDGTPPGGTFSFAIDPLAVTVPQGGMNFVDFTITRSGGFAEPITVSVDAPPSGLVFTPAMLGPTDTTGHVVVSATAQLALGTEFQLMLDATAGSGAAEIMKTAAVPATVTLAPGTLDSTFGSNGLVEHDSSRGAEVDAVAIGSDGFTLGVGGRFGLAGPFVFALRLDGAGSADDTFGTSGEADPNVLPPGGSGLEDAEPFAIGHQLAGNTILGGDAHNDAGGNDEILLVSLLANGSLDKKFGDLGMGPDDVGFVELDLGASSDVLGAMVIDGNDRPVFGGSRDGSGYVARANADGGGLDGGFGAGGIASLGGANTAITALALASNGRIVAVGTQVVGARSQIVVARLTSAGVLDAAFHGGAIETFGGSAFSESAAGVLVLADQSIEIVGTTTENGSGDIVVHRLGSDGTPDTTLGGDGHVVTSATDGTDAVRAVRQMADGRLVLALNVDSGSTPGPVLARIDLDGVLDPTFGTGGVAPIFIGTGGLLTGLDLDPAQQKIVVSGLFQGNPFMAGVLARFWN